MYFSGSHSNRSDAEIAVLARFDIVAVNKEEMPANSSCANSSASWHAHCGQELHQVETLRRVKAMNSAVFTMAYMNSMMNFGSQAIAPKYTDELLVGNGSGPFLFHGDAWRPGQGSDKNAVAAFNMSLPEARQIWLDDLQTFLDTGVVDGLFADKGNNWAGHGHCNGAKTGECWQLVSRNDTLCQNSCVIIGEAAAMAYNKGKIALFSEAEAMLRARGGVLALKNDTDPLFQSKAVYMRLVRPTRQTIEAFMDLEGKVDTLIAWALPANSPHAKNQQNWHNTLAAFLIAAWDGMFLEASPCCGTSATDAWTPEYGFKLGPPLAKAVLQANGTYHRKFASGTTVDFDTLTGVGTVSWASHSLE